MFKSLPRVHLLILLACLGGLAIPRFHAQQPGTSVKEPENLHLYLLIGGSNMAGQAEIPQDAGDIIDRCYLLNDKNEWEPARNPLNRYSPVNKADAIHKLGPGYGFALKMLERNKDISIGLIVNAREGTKIDDWLGRSETYLGARRRVKAATQHGTLQGILWHQGESDRKSADGYLEKLQSLVGNLRADFTSGSLPFVAGQIHNDPALNAQISKLPDTAHATAFVSSEGLNTADGEHSDTKSQLALGERYAEQMIRL